MDWLAIPLALTAWSGIPIGSQKLPSVAVNDGQWGITTNGNAGGYAHFFDPNTLANVPKELRWSWRVIEFPKVNPEIPFQKKTDDYALRVGALVSIPGNPIQLPQSLKKKLPANQVPPSFVVFYGAVRSTHKQEKSTDRCAPSPYNARILHCLIGAHATFENMTRSPLEDAARHLNSPDFSQAKARFIGLWIFADSDNSQSSSQALIKELSVR